MNLVFIIDATAASFQAQIKAFINDILLGTNNVYSNAKQNLLGVNSRIQVALVSMGDGARSLENFLSFDYLTKGASVNSMNIIQAGSADVTSPVQLIKGFLDSQAQLFGSRAVDPNVFVYITYRTPQSQGLQAALEQYNIPDTRVICVGVETPETVVDQISSVNGWGMMVQNFNELQSFATYTQNLICDAALPGEEEERGYSISILTHSILFLAYFAEATSSLPILFV